MNPIPASLCEEKSLNNRYQVNGDCRINDQDIRELVLILLVSGSEFAKPLFIDGDDIVKVVK